MERSERVMNTERRVLEHAEYNGAAHYERAGERPLCGATGGRYGFTVARRPLTVSCQKCLKIALAARVAELETRDE